MLAPWYVRSRPLQGRTGAAVFAATYGQPPPEPWANPNQAIAVLLESPYPLPVGVPQSRLARYSLCAGPPRYQGARSLIWTPPIGAILATLGDRLATPKPKTVLLDEQGRPWPQPLPTFAGGWLGWLGYDLAWEIEQLPSQNPDPLPFPVAFWYEPDSFILLDHQQQQLWLATSHPKHLDDLEATLTQAEDPPATSPQAQGLTLASTQGEYEAAVRQAKAHIQAGDIFQANLSLRFSTQTVTDSWAIYRQLQAINPSPFASYWRTPWGAMISCSPERLVSVQGRQVETRPIAGTRSRGDNPQADQALAQALLANTKERAEHIMLVDLERNDLGRVCNWGSVQVDELMTLEYYSHVMHLVSNVKGELRSPLNPIDVIRALFPGGTITGCPKVRCMEIIEALEPVRRSLFYGSCGYLDWRGNLDLNILIRTLLWVSNREGDGATVWGQVGAGIVADSDPRQEWQESLQKAKAQLQALGL
ncbi:MAG: anthranilate synthase component I [Cyanobacteria bacterium]|nr:anthranilate synthase component I [Cyanobacteriota bacterium]